MIEDIFDGGHRRATAAGDEWSAEEFYRQEGTPEPEVYLVPAGKTWANWEDVNGVLDFYSDAEVMEIYRQNLEDFGDAEPDDFGNQGVGPFRERATPRTAEEAWKIIDDIWQGDPGGRGWHERVPDGATWVQVTHKDGEVPAPTWGSGPPPPGVQLARPGY